MREYYLAENLHKKYATREPYELLECIGAEVRVNYDFDPGGLKGFATILNRIKFVVINGNLNEHEQRTVAGHEAAHLILHKTDILNSPAYTLRDFNLFNNSGRLEYQANSFLADFLLSDEAVLEVIEDGDYFSHASILCVPPPLLAFKLHSMVRRDYKVKLPVSIESSFLLGSLRKDF